MLDTALRTRRAMATIARASLLVCLLAFSPASAFSPPTRTLLLPSVQATARRTAIVLSNDEPAPKVNVGSLVGYGLLLVYLSPLFARAAFPDFVEMNNMFTDIANNAADEAMAAGTLQLGTFMGYPISTGTWYAQDVWKSLYAEYFSSGRTTDFLTAAGGFCAQHVTWCEGVTIVP